MARGKQTCKILREIRRQIAEANDIEFITSECRYKGDCRGTCPKCEAEVRYLEQQLRSRQLMGKAVVLAGLSAGVITMAGCGNSSQRTTEDGDTLKGEPIAMTDTIDEFYEGEISAFEVKEGEMDDSIECTPVNQKKTEATDEQVVVGEIIDPENPETEYDTIVDVRPSFPGGDEKLMEWIAQHFIYPPVACENQVQGKVIIEFWVMPDGSIDDAKVKRSVDPDLDEEALRVVRGLPRFNPAQLNGKAVKSRFTLPIVFRLE